MKRELFISAVAFLCAGTAGLAAEETNSSPPAVAVSRFDFDSFRIIAERNIFNPNRSSRSDERFTRREPERRTRSESFALVGTMSYEKGRFAFFEGSSSDYRKVLETTGTIAGYTVAEITPNHVKLEANGKAIELPVGSELRKQDEGEWQLGARSTSTGSASEASAPSAGSSSGGEESDVLKRLLQKREQEAGGGLTDAPANAVKTEEKPATDTNAGADEILKRLMQKREQEQNNENK